MAKSGLTLIRADSALSHRTVAPYNASVLRLASRR